MSAIAIIGMACRYAQARSPRQLWENVLAQRQAFRRIPPSRLRVADYDGGEDRITARLAAVLEDYEFDRARFHISKDTFASTDLTHWLALETTARALEDARLLTPGPGTNTGTDGGTDNALRERAGVYIGNSLTGEFSRAGLMRLRWPYVQRVLAAVLHQHENGGREHSARLLAEVEALYKAPFPPTTEDSLAGGLSNTIAGRICNYFNLKGGGYTVDGACASSLLAVITACSALESRDIDIAIAGGVDLSLDPFELAGFSKLGAISSGGMRVFDAHSSGFVPGEGCGLVVLMRQEDAMAFHRSPYALIRGWGISSDGSGGITRPELAGQMLALRRAYERAGYGIESVGYFEGHGTGTAIGDATELQALSQSRHAAGAQAMPAAIGSVKANIGHTKAAAGIAGLIKAAMAVHARLLPPTTGCERPHSELAGGQPMLRILHEGELWPEGVPVRAGVSAMGFGGINTHITLESADVFQRANLTAFERRQTSSRQDCELFVFRSESAAELARTLETLLPRAGEICFAEMPDLAAELARMATGSRGSVRAACVASTPDELETGLARLRSLCLEGTAEWMDTAHGVFLSHGVRQPRIGFLFPGQGSPVQTSGGIWSRRFASIRELYEKASLPAQRSNATEIAQPCVVTASLAGLQALDLLGIQASVALGHSLGEITALGWAGVFANDHLLRIASQRGRIMAEMADPAGSMASIRAGSTDVKSKLNGDPLVIAAYNSPRQTVVAGDAGALRQFTSRLASDGIASSMLPVSHAFHSPLVKNVATAFSSYLANECFGRLRDRVLSTVTGALLEDGTDLRQLLSSQITLPVKFSDALALAADETDLLIEVGPGSVLTGIAAECAGTPVIALNSGGESLRGLLLAAGAAFALGADVRAAALFDERFTRPFDLNRRPSFLQNPCETIPSGILSIERASAVAPVQESSPALPSVSMPAAPVQASAIHVLLNLVAQRTELPLASIRPENRFLDDLHLNSITISQIILEAAEALNLAAPAAPAEYTNATLAEAAQTLDELGRREQPRTVVRPPQGIAPWLRVLAVELVEAALPSRPPGAAGSWQIVAPGNGAAESFLQSLRERFRTVPGSGVVCCVPPARDDAAATFLLECAQAALRRKVEQVVFLQQEATASALARSLYLEHPEIKVTVVHLPFANPLAGQWASCEAHSASGFTEAHYDHDGRRREPRLRLLWPDEDQGTPQLGAENLPVKDLLAEDLLLVTGGGKGIAAESALDLARRTGCRLALIGRSQPGGDLELQQNLLRFTDAGVAFRYYSADITDPAAVKTALRTIESEMGGITALLHGAGSNVPRRMEDLTPDDLRAALAPKLNGLRNILAHLDSTMLRLLITFGSIIGRTGLHGEAHYGLANEWLTQEAELWREQHPACRCLNLEWSVWAGAGMGQRLGVLESLTRQGITPLPLEDAIRQLSTMLAWDQAPVSSIITGRMGTQPTLRFRQPELPLLRFLEHVQVYYPGIELIADAELSNDTDLYVAEHAFQGEQLIPAVVAMEAMTQVAMTLEESSELPELHPLRFEHPLVIPRGRGVTLRIAALRRRPGVVSVAVRCSSTSFQTDHFSGECIFHSALPHPAPEQRCEPPAATRRHVALDPERDMYGSILFHQGRFRRVEGYRLLHAAGAIAELSPPSNGPWYARHLPPEFRMGDAAARDAAIHCLQACIPHRTVLPVGVDRIVPHAGWTRERATVHAVERVRNGNDFLFDLSIRNPEGEICEQWEGLHLRAVAPGITPRSWPPPLLAPYLERKLDELLPAAGIRIHLLNGTEDERETEAREIVKRIACPEARIGRRPDGKPEIHGCSKVRLQISRSHCDALTLLAFSENVPGCDVEPVAGRSEGEWRQLLRTEEMQLAQLLAGQSHSSLDSAASQVFTLRECLRKAGANLDMTLRFDAAPEPGWAVFSGGGFRGATCLARTTTLPAGAAFGFVVKQPQ